MIACCDLCYKKYIEKNGEIDLISLANFVREIRISENLSWNETQKLMNEPCKCECHIKGSSILH